MFLSFFFSKYITDNGSLDLFEILVAVLYRIDRTQSGCDLRFQFFIYVNYHIAYPPGYISITREDFHAKKWASHHRDAQSIFI